MPLSAFPKAFGLTKHKKGFFPHFLTLPTIKTTWGPYPPSTTMIHKACPLKEPTDSSNGTMFTAPITSSTFKKNWERTVSLTCYSSKGPVRSFAKSSRRLAVSTPCTVASPLPQPVICSIAPNTCHPTHWPGNPLVDGTIMVNHTPRRPWNGWPPWITPTRGAFVMLAMGENTWFAMNTEPFTSMDTIPSLVRTTNSTDVIGTGVPNAFWTEIEQGTSWVHIFELRRMKWKHDWSSQLHTQLKQLRN